MSPPLTPRPDTRQPRLRAGDAEREATADVLRQAHVEGRLRVDELDERLDAAFAATYVDELGPLTADLPPAAAVAEPPGRADIAPGRWGTGRPGPGRPPRPFLGLLVALAVIASVVALSSGAPPWPLLWLGVAAVLVGTRRRRVAYAATGPHAATSPHAGYGCSRR